MKYLKSNTLLICSVLLSPFYSNAKVEVPSKEIQEARSLVKAFGGQLKSTLKTAMKTGGPVKALEACNVQAEPIAKAHSLTSDWVIGRTSLKSRNSTNEPDSWETKTLLQFEKRLAAGENLKTIEHSEYVGTGDNAVFRYMKAIPTAALCETCHGNNINKELAKNIKSLYPNDKATGFTAGDIRGAFSLKKGN